MNICFKECEFLSLYIFSFFYFFGGMGGGGVGGDGENMAARLMLGQSLCSKKNDSTPLLHHLGLNHYLFDLTLQISLSHDEKWYKSPAFNRHAVYYTNVLLICPSVTLSVISRRLHILQRLAKFI